MEAKKVHGIRATDTQANIIFDVLKERDRQYQIYGDQVHSPEMWLSILGEEDGEVAEARDAFLANKLSIAMGKLHRQVYENQAGYPDAIWEDYRDELIHVLAVALSMCEAFDDKGIEK